MTARPARRVVVTGTGAVCAWGFGCDAMWRGLRSGETAIRPFGRFDHRGYATHLAGEVPGPALRDRDRYASIADRFAVSAASEALGRSGLPPDLSDRGAAVFFGSSTGGMFETERFYSRLLGEPSGRSRPDIRLLASQMVSGPGEEVARRFRVAGPVETVSSACSSGALAVGLGLEAVRLGAAEVAIVGGADSLCRITYGGFNALRSVDPEPCQPFRAQRRGLSLGEGAGVLILEELDAARKRDARPMAELLGAGTSCDAHHMTAPDPEGAGAAAAIERALDAAGVGPDDVDFINAHGTGTPLNDIAEYRAFRRVFGERASRIPLTATKASVGHLLGSAGAIEAVATVLSLERQTIPPVPGAGPVDPETPVNLIRERPLECDLDVAVSLNLAFGGCNGALVFAHWQEA